ncbi:uncharacterized protein LOC118199002 [Stegodyphus dumicola]|uniref:uncharacterized protein LOC118199002 n=1 Tax=Stegodyphus dumicola TaxID=202533 RepID=UPI0015A93B30|nr:uncharacterized protein LOC118199002 [Stegodyphus dumicola]
MLGVQTGFDPKQTGWLHEIYTTESTALKNNSGNFTALQQGSSFDDFKENVGLSLGAIVSIPIVGVIFVCCCCYWCCRCCCDSCRDDTPNVIVMNSNETHAAPPPQIIVQPFAVQPHFQQIPQTQYGPQPPYAPPPGYSEFSNPSNYKY